MGSEWPSLKDEELERLLIERWVVRGLLLAAMLAMAITTTLLGAQGLESVKEKAMAGGLLLLALAAAAVCFFMRLTDLRIHRELRRRKQGLS